jgi:pimeloyl-ACP methyl ester carboxylesterase
MTEPDRPRYAARSTFVEARGLQPYLGDLDAVLESLLPGRALDLVGYSMGGYVSMIYAGMRPARVRRLVNHEGFGLRAADAVQAPDRLRDWLDELRAPTRLRDYDPSEAVATRLVQTNPRLSNRFVETDAYRERLRATPTLERASVEQAGHMLHHDQPDRVASLIEECFDA